MAIVVTGASGFVGRSLVGHLARRGVDVLAVSRRGHCFAPPARSLVVDDYARLPAAGDVLVHLAESPHAAQAEGSAERSAAALRALAGRGFSRLVYASSGVVYGDRAETPRRPSDPLQGEGAYARAKREAEAVVAERGGVIARLGNVIGPEMHEGTVSSDILAQLDGEGPLLLRDLGPVRDYVWVDDVAEGLAGMALGRATGAFNLASGQGVSVAELARRACALAGRPDRAIVGRGAPSRSHLTLDIGETTEAFGWRPRTALDEALRRLISLRAASRMERAAQ